MPVNCICHNQDSRGTESEDHFHGANKGTAESKSSTGGHQTGTFITKLSIGCVEVVNKAALAWGITPPIRSESGFRRRERRKSLYSRRENVPAGGSGLLGRIHENTSGETEQSPSGPLERFFFFAPCCNFQHSGEVAR